MGDWNRDIVELLESAKLDILNATSATARSARAHLAAALRKACADRAVLTSRLAVRAYKVSEFLREMAWMSDPIDPALFARQRREFADIMDQLAFEVGVMQLKPVTAPAPKPRQQRKAPVPRPVAPPRPTFAAALARWLRGGEASKPARRLPGRVARPLLPGEVRPFT